MDHESVRRWLDAYVRAWESGSPDDIGNLFTTNATYAYHPWDDPPLSGREEISASWLEEWDPPGSWSAEYSPLLVEGDRAVATGLTRYDNGDTFWNLWELDFDDGRCSRFVEWYMVRRTQ